MERERERGSRDGKATAGRRSSSASWRGHRNVATDNCEKTFSVREANTDASCSEGTGGKRATGILIKCSNEARAKGSIGLTKAKSEV